MKFFSDLLDNIGLETEVVAEQLIYGWVEKS